MNNQNSSDSESDNEYTTPPVLEQNQNQPRRVSARNRNNRNQQQIQHPEDVGEIIQRGRERQRQQRNLIMVNQNGQPPQDPRRQNGQLRPEEEEDEHKQAIEERAPSVQSSAQAPAQPQRQQNQQLQAPQLAQQMQRIDRANRNIQYENDRADQRLTELENMMRQFLANNNGNNTNPRPYVPKFVGLEEEEVRELLATPDLSDFYEGFENIRVDEDDFEDRDAEKAEKRLRKQNFDKMDNKTDAIKWLDKFDYVCNELKIPYSVRFTVVITKLFSEDLTMQFRAARLNTPIDTYESLKRWIFRSRNGRLNIIKARSKLEKWKPKHKNDTLQQWNSFLNVISKYKNEVSFALRWGMKTYEINRVEEGVMFDIFMNRASATEKLWEIFNEKVTGRRTIKKASLLAKHISHIEIGQLQVKKKNKKNKTAIVNMVDKETDKYCTIHDSRTHTTEECYENPKNKQTKKRPWHKSKFDKNWRNKKGKKGYGRKWNKKRHIGGENCEDYGHTPAECWQLHPEKRPKGRRDRKIMMLQQQLWDAEQEMIETETEEEQHEHETCAPIDETQDREKSDMSEQESDDEQSTEQDSDSESSEEYEFAFKYRPRRE